MRPGDGHLADEAVVLDLLHPVLQSGGDELTEAELEGIASPRGRA